MNKATAFAPATAANLAVGFDLLGLSLGMIGDEVTVEKISTPDVVVRGISGLTSPLPKDAKNNSASAGLIRLQQDLNLPFGFAVSIRKGIPIGSGMGGSAASAVAAVVAANALLDQPLPPLTLLRYALIGEGVATGAAHADNVAPCLFGGITLATLTTVARVISQEGEVHDPNALPEVDVVSFPIPKGLYCVLVHPHLRLDTRDARGVLKTEITLQAHIQQSSYLAGFVAACYNSDLELLKRSLRDVVIEPQRAHLIPGFYQVQEAALNAGALGCSISGAGPSVFALAANATAAKLIKGKMTDAFSLAGLKCDSWVISLPAPGARLIP